MEPRNKLVEITRFNGNKTYVERRACAHHFAGSRNHRLVAQGASVGFGGESAARAAARLMDLPDATPREPDVFWYASGHEVAGKFYTSIFAPASTKVGDKIYSRGQVFLVTAIHSDELQLEEVC